MRPLKVSTEVTALIGPFVDKTDGVTEETGLAGADTEISKAGAAFGAGPVLGTHDSDGWYPITLTTTHTNTVGQLLVKVHAAATHLPVWEVFTVLPAVVYDSLIGGTDTLQVDTVQWLGTACATPTTNGVPEVDVTHWGGTAVGSAYVQANTAQFAGQTITCVGGVTIPAATLASTTGAVGSVTAAVTLTADYDAAKTAATQTSVNTIDDFLDTEMAAVLEAVDTEVAAIKAKTDNLPASPAAVGSAMTLANDSITADAVADTGANEIADALLNRDMSTGADSGSATVRTPRQALRFLRNKWSVSGTTLTVCKENDSTASWTAEVTTDAAADPITASDPASS